MTINKKYKVVAEAYGTPYYLFDRKALEERVEAIKDILGKETQLCYAMKANPFLISYLDSLVDKFEVCSHGEYRICKQEKIDSKKIILSGVYKEKIDLKETFEDKFEGVYTLESRSQCNLLHELARENNRKVHVLIRLTSGNQFGMNKEDIEEIMNDSRYNEFFIVEGLHYFSGTQKKKQVFIEKEIDEIIDFCKIIKQKYNKNIKKLEYGPGLYIDYFGDMIESLNEIQYLTDKLERISNETEVTIELGRYITALCGKYVTRVVDVKKNQGINYAITNGGIHHLGYHGQIFGIKFPRVSVIHKVDKESVREKWMICGSLCTMHDILLKDYETEPLQENDLLVFHDTGAYAMTDTNVFFLSRDLPTILVENSDGTVECIRKKIESYHFNGRNT